MADDKSGKPPPLMGATAIRPPERTGAEKYTYILYDPKNGTILTRTPKSWALIILFYCIYYSCLAAFWTACMTIFLKIQIEIPGESGGRPTWTLGESIIGVRPGLGIRPAQTYEEVDSGIFSLDGEFEWKGGDVQTAIDTALEELKDKGKWSDVSMIEGSKGYAFRAYEYFKAFGTSPDAEDCKNAPADQPYDKHGKFCTFDLTTLGPCTTFPYGYAKGAMTPCVFIKLNRIMDLIPKAINKDNVGEQDESLKKDVSGRKFMEDLATAGYPNKVLVKCEGEYPADKEILNGHMDIFPKQDGIANTAEIPLKYFPYDKYRKDGKENPLVAIQFKDLDPLKGRLLHVICKAYYDGVIHSKKDKAGLVKFNVMLK